MSSAINRLGIYKSWHSFNSWEKFQERYAVNTPPMFLPKLQHYVETGDALLAESYLEQSTPRWINSYVEGAMTMPALVRVSRWMVDTYHGRGGEDNLTTGLEWKRTALLARYQFHKLQFYPGYNGHKLGLISIKDPAPWIALMIAAQHRGLEDGKRMAKIALAAYQYDWYFDRDEYPLFHMILRVFADWLNIAGMNWSPIATSEPIMNAVVENWRTPDLEALTPILLNACDYHTHRCRAKQFFEFNNGEFDHLAIEILMILRLRESLGLANPVLDHPLMNTPLGKLPPPQPPSTDELLLAVQDRMKSQGFDDDAILKSVGA